jgi:hypothetical protein
VLRGERPAFDLYILHSSLDVDQCLKAMEAEASEDARKVGGIRSRQRTFASSQAGSLPWVGRQVILATNIAESSVTVPNCEHVVDFCRCIEVSWSRELRTHRSRPSTPETSSRQSLF